LLTKNRTSAIIDNSNQVINPENIFIEEGASVHCSILNAAAGPIYIAKDAEVMEGSMIRGPFALGEHSALKMGAKIYGPTTIGPECKVGGEVNNSVIFGYSNKAHDGFLGNSVIGEWCNLGADTNNSNLKNNYGQVKVWDIAKNDWQATGLQFCGLLMGDHSKAGINTMFNTGTVTGFCANIFDGGFPPKYIPSYSWGGHKNAPKFELAKAMEVATRVFERRGLHFNEGDRAIFEYLFEK
jgi:UDP-N-acetylglucosamine diphosphorylase/glucosamine-1-phosphate N-acetyltransferase